MKVYSVIKLGVLLWFASLAQPLTRVNAGGLGTGSTPAKLQDFETVFGSLLTAIVPTAGIIFFVMLIVGGFKYMTAAGEPGSVAAAHKTITYALGGLLVTALAFTIIAVVQFVTGAQISQFLIVR